MKRLTSSSARLQAARRNRQEALYPERFRQDGLLEQQADLDRTARHLRNGIKAQLGFLFAALIGLALVFAGPQQWSSLHAMIQRAAQWLRL